MSASKERFFHASGRGAWLRVTPRARCPMCGGDSWCQVSRDGGMSMCMRNATGIERSDANGQTYYLHTLDESVVRATPGPDVGGAPRASVDVLDEGYRAVLSSLTLTDAHRDGLERRGLSRDEVRARGCRTLPLEGRSAVARAVVARLGDAARGIPGMYVRAEGDRTWWTLAGSPGLLVPVRDVAGRIVALKVRRDDAGDGPRYLYVTSASHDGPGALLSVHVPMMGDAVCCDDVRVTEGELKADVASVLSDVPTISIPGVGSWRSALPVLEQLGAKRVRVAFDADHRTKPEVGTALSLLVSAVVEAGLGVTVECWDSEAGKGIDDVLVTRGAASVRELRDGAAQAYARAIGREAAMVRGARMVAA